MDRYVVRTSKLEVELFVEVTTYRSKGIARSYYVNSMELRNYLSKAQPDIVVLLQETWLHKNSTVSFPGYAVLRKDRPADYGAEVGGVATIIRKDAGIKHDKIDEEIAPNDRCEMYL